jgi:AcrR family transcriptional regulator
VESKDKSAGYVGDHYHHGALREALLTEAFRTLETGGLDGLSLRGLAEATGVSKTAPYRHFADKRDLLVSVAAEGFRELADALEAALASSPGTDESADVLREIRSLVRAYVDFARARPALYRLMFSRLGYSLHSESCRRNSMRALDCLTRSVARAQGHGWRAEQEPRGVVLSLWAAVHGWAGLLIDGLLPPELVAEGEDWFRFAESFLG